MKKIYGLILILLLTLGALVACGNTTNKESSEQKNTTEQGAKTENGAFPVTIKDATGEDVTIEKEPARIVTLIPSNTEIAFELGLGEKIVGVSDNDNYPEETKNIEKIGGMEINTEKILSLQPDLVLAHASGTHYSAEALKQLKDAGITVLVVNDAKSFENVYESIEMIGQATGKSEKAEEVVTNMKTKFEEIAEKAKAVKEEDRKKVLIEVSPAPEIYIAGSNTFMDEMLKLIGADNAAGELKDWPKMEEESMIKENPDVIVTTYGYYTEDAVSQVLGRKGWEDVTAMKEKQVYDIHSDVVTRPGPRLAEGVEELAKAVYPNVFSK